MSTTKYINKIPYAIYFFSTNLEHVLHNIQNATDTMKTELAIKFEDKFYNCPQEFLAFINNPDFAIFTTYDESWQTIKMDNNSLKRLCNFHLFFNNEN